MEKATIIEKVTQHKNQPNLKFQLKEKTEAFTKRLFYTLFDIETPVEESLEILEKEF